MATNKERTSSAAMRKLLLQSASKKEQEIQQIGSVAESTIPQPAIEHPIHEEVKESAPVKETVQEPQPEQMEKPESISTTAECILVSASSPALPTLAASLFGAFVSSLTADLQSLIAASYCVTS